MAALLLRLLLPHIFSALVTGAAPLLQLTSLGGTLTTAQRSQLKAAAARIIAGGANRWPSYMQPGTLANYYTPDDHSDPRRHYGSQYVRDFTYSFTMAADVVNGSDIANILEYLMSGQDPATGEMPEGGVPPATPMQNCWDNGPFLAKAVASYALLYEDFEYLCGVHRRDNATRVSKLLRGLEFLEVPLRTGAPHLVTSPGTHCMYGFTDGEHKMGHVLYDSLLLIEGAQLMADALLRAAAEKVGGCEGAKRLEEPFLALAAAVNDTLSSARSPLEDRIFGSGLMLATDAFGHNSQPDVWGSGLAVQIGAGTAAQRMRMQAALAANASRIFRWGQARHLIWPMCWQSATPYPGFMNQNECTETGGAPGSIEYSWCSGQPCGFYQNGGYWSTPLGWLLPAVARANFSLAAALLQDALNDSLVNGFNEAVNHDAHYNPPQKFPPQTYQGVHGYLASVASIYGAVWTVRRGAAPSPPLPAPAPLPPPPPAATCVKCQKGCAAPPPLPQGASACSNLTGHWTGSWTGSYVYSVLESASHEVVFCSNLKQDCWSTATGQRRWDGTLHLTFHRCKPFADVVNKSFEIDADCKTMTSQDGKYTRLKTDDTVYSLPALQSYTVVISTAASPADHFAANELAGLLGNITNAHVPLPVTTTAAAADAGNRLFVGYLASVTAGVTAAKMSRLREEGFIITAVGLPAHCVAFAGGRGNWTRGVTFAVYHFLELLGYRTLAWDATLLPPGSPHLVQLQLPPMAKLEVKALGAPSGFMWREIDDWPVYNSAVFGRRLRLNGGNGYFDCVYDVPGTCPGGFQAQFDLLKWAEPPGMCHTAYPLVCSNATHGNARGTCPRFDAPPQDFFKSKNHWFWPHNCSDPSQCRDSSNMPVQFANSSYGQLCWHNEDLILYLIEQARDMLTAVEAQPGPPPRFFSVTQNDNIKMCQDPEELFIVDENGGAVVAPMLAATNRIAIALADEFPDVLFDTFAYVNTLQAPTKIRPADNVVIRVCTAECNFAAPLTDPVNALLAGNITEWAKISKQLTVWDYTVNFLRPVQPFPDWFAVGENLAFWKEHKVIGYMAQGSTAFPPGTDLHELKTYVTSRILWDSGRDPLAEIAQFIVLYYGEEVGGPAVKLYMETMIGSMIAIGYCRADDGRSLGFPPTAPFLTPSAVVTAANGFAAALRSPQLSATHRARLERASLSIGFVVLVRWSEMQSWANASGTPWLLPASKQRAYDDFERIGNATEKNLGRSRDSLGSHPLSWYRQQVFNSSAREWCLPFVGPQACNFSWVSEQPCCPGCGEDQPPRPGSNLCLNDTRLPPSFDAPALLLPAAAALDLKSEL
eukprot:SAG11_NODE_963_length_6375_cov_6.744105_2_plen_1331_part_00